MNGTIADNFVYVTKNDPCPICGKGDWCQVRIDGNYTVCARVSEGAIRQLGANGAGWLHYTGDGTERQPVVAPRKPQAPAPEIDAPAIHRMFRDRALVQDGLEVRATAQRLGVSTASLNALEMGFSWRHGAATFPMRNDRGRVIGIRLRNANGEKWAVTGSKSGLIYPLRIPTNGLLWICEGPTDCAAMLDYGVAAVARASCNSETLFLCAIAKRTKRDMVIVSDMDGPGVNGAERLRDALSAHVAVRIVMPPAGFKDARQARIAGKTLDGFTTAPAGAGATR